MAIWNLYSRKGNRPDAVWFERLPDPGRYRQSRINASDVMLAKAGNRQPFEYKQRVPNLRSAISGMAD
jgi:hypothetical protein